MTETKRAKMLDLLQRHAAGQSYRDMQKDWRISRGSISGLLHEAEQVAGVRFLPETNGTGINAAIREVTRTRRAVGLKSASRYDFHALRTTFVTLALNAGISVEKLKALTGHSLVETVMRHYYKPRGTDSRAELEAALPDVLTGNGATPKQIGAGVAGLARQLQALSKTDRAALAKLLKEG
jgi:integrase